ncbi:magnesium transporter [Deferribacterales bacterium RsTz2092]
MDLMRVKLENVKKLVRRSVKGPLQKVLVKLHPADIAYIIRHLSDIDRKKVWACMTDNMRIAETIIELDDSSIVELFEEMEPQKAADVLQEMNSDDISYVLRLLPEELKDKITQYIGDKDLSAVEELLHYPDDSAGAMMNTEYIALNVRTTVKEATKLIHKAADVELVYYLYVVDDEGRLVGVLSLRQLITNPPDKTLADIMISDIISVQDHTDKEDAARLVAKYDLLALPVVDEQRHIMGIITFDDVMDVIREEATEEIYRMAGASQEAFDYGESTITNAKARLPWLIVTLVGELMSGFIITFFQGKIVDFLVISAFMPVIMAMGGNVGSQSSTIIIRNIALGNIDNKRAAVPVVWREMKTGFLMGIVSAVPVTLILPLFGGGQRTGLIVGVSLFCAMGFAAFVGAHVPLVLMRLNVDPAVASGPFISTFNDITGLTIYFSVAIAMVSLLG